MGVLRGLLRLLCPVLLESQVPGAMSQIRGGISPPAAKKEKKKFFGDTPNPGTDCLSQLSSEEVIEFIKE